MLLIENTNKLKDVKSQLYCKFDMNDLEVENFILGIEIKRYLIAKTLWLTHREYVETTL
jgi:hypothetical protein